MRRNTRTRTRSETETERGQAYTLEGFVSAMIVLMAVLFALQSVVITPTTGGLPDRTATAQVEQEAQDALVLGATANGSTENGTGDLSTLVRYWNTSNGEFYGSNNSEVADFHYDATNDTEFAENFTLGSILADRFTERGLSYNVELVYWDNTSETYDTEALVYQGKSEAMTASYTVTLYESDNLTAPHDRDVRLRDAYYCDGGSHSEGCYPIPPAHDDPETSEIYNVVEVRVSVW